MKGIEKITNRIREEAEADAAVVLNEAKAKADEILAGYREQAKLLYEERHEAGLAEAAAAADRKNRNAGLSAKKAILSVKHVLVKDAYKVALQDLLSLPKEDYINLLAKYAVSAASSGTEELMLSAKDKAAIGGKLVEIVNTRLAAEGKTAKIRLSEKEADIQGGLILAENDIAVNCSLEKLVYNLCESMDRSVAGILFG